MQISFDGESCFLFLIIFIHNIIIIYSHEIRNDNGIENGYEKDDFNKESSYTFVQSSIDKVKNVEMGTNSDKIVINSNTCNSTSQLLLINGTCIPRANAHMNAITMLYNNLTNATIIIDALSLYFNAISDLPEPQKDIHVLELNELDNIIDHLKDVTIQRNTKSSFIIAQPPNQDNNTIILGASFVREIGGQIINTLNIHNIINSNLAAAAILNPQSLIDVTSLKMLIIKEPSKYRNTNRSNDGIIVSSIIVASIERANSISTPINISLYFQVLDEYVPSMSGKYHCSFFDANTLRWNSSGCTKSQYNANFNRYECSCNHLTIFGLVWLPNTPQPIYLTSQDIAVLVFLSIAIACFITVIIHSFIVQLINPAKSIKTRDLLPLISSASTTILFILYIALTMTVYTQTTSVNEFQCFLSARILMFITYFFLIFMLCVKTSISYFYYLRLIHLYSQPAPQKLFVLLIISFFVAIISTSLAAGFNSNSSFNITQLHGNKFCWFTRDVIYYFLTIPVAIFILLNFVTTIFVAKYMLDHGGHTEKSYQFYEQMKRCVLVLLSSCLTQGVAWLLSPFISFLNVTAAYVLGWIFIVLNGSEGLWTILLCITIQSLRLMKQKHVNDYEEIATASAPPLEYNG